MKSYLLFFGLLVSSLFGCKKIDGWTQFQLQVDEKAAIPAMLSLNLPFDILTPNVSASITKELEIKNTQKKRVEKIHLEQLQLTLQEGGNTSFAFLKKIEIFLKVDGLPDVMIASKENITNDIGNTLLLEVNPTELKPYILEDTVKLKIKVTLDQIVTQDAEVLVQADFFVDARIMGI